MTSSENRATSAGIRSLHRCWKVKRPPSTPAHQRECATSAQPHRRVPFHVRKQLEDQLARDEQNDVIERVDGPISWVSPVVVAPKPKQPGKIRMCIDMRQANTAIQRERHITPTNKEVIADLNVSTVFSKLHLNQATTN